LSPPSTRWTISSSDQACASKFNTMGFAIIGRLHKGVNTRPVGYRNVYVTKSRLHTRLGERENNGPKNQSLLVGAAHGPWRGADRGRVDKFFNLLTNWEQYVSPLAQKMLPLSPTSLMHVVGVVEMVVGLAILTKATRLGAYVASAWLVCIALALLTTGHFFDIAVRDLELAVAAFILAKLTEIRESSAVETNRVPQRLRPEVA